MAAPNGGVNIGDVVAQCGTECTVEAVGSTTYTARSVVDGTVYSVDRLTPQSTSPCVTAQCVCVAVWVCSLAVLAWLVASARV